MGASRAVAKCSTWNIRGWAGWAGPALMELAESRVGPAVGRPTAAERCDVPRGTFSAGCLLGGEVRWWTRGLAGRRGGRPVWR